MTYKELAEYLLSLPAEIQNQKAYACIGCDQCGVEGSSQEFEEITSLKYMPTNIVKENNYERLYTIGDPRRIINNPKRYPEGLTFSYILGGLEYCDFINKEIDNYLKNK